MAACGKEDSRWDKVELNTIESTYFPYCYGPKVSLSTSGNFDFQLRLDGTLSGYISSNCLECEPDPNWRPYSIELKFASLPVERDGKRMSFTAKKIKVRASFIVARDNEVAYESMQGEAVISGSVDTDKESLSDSGSLDGDVRIHLTLEDGKKVRIKLVTLSRSPHMALQEDSGHYIIEID